MSPASQAKLNSTATRTFYLLKFDCKRNRVHYGVLQQTLLLTGQ